ncbi:hypothetical protein ABPG74_021609 [Tetrahymena malaccensis]
MLGHLRERILHVKLYGPIDQAITVKLHQSFKNKQLYDIQLIAVSINSHGGSLIQAKNICTALKYFSQKTSAPVYTFAEDMVLNSANLILSSGNKVFAGKYSLLGDFGYSYQGFGYKGLLENYNVKAEFVHAGEKKVKLNPFQDLKQEDAQWMKNYLLEREYDLKSSVIQTRAQKFHDLKLSNEQVNKELLDKGMIEADQAKQLGLIDGIKTFEELAHEQYHGVKILDAIPTGSFTNNLLKSNTLISNSLSFIQ